MCISTFFHIFTQIRKTTLYKSTHKDKWISKYVWHLFERDKREEISLYIHPSSLHYEHVCMLRCFSCVWLFSTLWTVAHQVPLSLGFSRQECWSRLPCPPPGDFPNPGSEQVSLNFSCIAGRFFTTSTTWKASYSRPISSVKWGICGIFPP